MTDTSVDNKNKKITKTGRGVLSKAVLYASERKDVLNKMLTILGITDTNKIFYIQEIDADKSKIESILNLESDIKKFFAYSTWSIAVKKVKKPWFSMVKSILRDSNVGFVTVPELDSKTRLVVRTGIKINL